MCCGPDRHAPRWAIRHRRSNATPVAPQAPSWDSNAQLRERAARVARSQQMMACRQQPSTRLGSPTSRTPSYNPCNARESVLVGEESPLRPTGTAAVLRLLLPLLLPAAVLQAPPPAWRQLPLLLLCRHGCGGLCCHCRRCCLPGLLLVCKRRGYGVGCEAGGPS